MPKVSRDHGPSDKLVDPDWPPSQEEVDRAQAEAPVAQEDLADAQPEEVRVDGEGKVWDLTDQPTEDPEVAAQAEAGDQTEEQLHLPNGSAIKAEWEDALCDAGVSAEWVLADGRTKDQLVQLGYGLRDGEVELDSDGNPPEDV